MLGIVCLVLKYFQITLLAPHHLHPPNNPPSPLVQISALCRPARIPQPLVLKRNYQGLGEKCFEMQQPRRPARSLLILCLVERDDKRCWVIARSWVTHSPGSRHVYLHLLSSLPIRYSIPQELILSSFSVLIEEFSKKL